MEKSQTNIDSRHASQAFITQLDNSHQTLRTQGEDENARIRLESPDEEAAGKPQLPTKLGVVGEIDVINGILEKVKAKTNKINVNSPRTKQALENLGILKEECIVK